MQLGVALRPASSIEHVLGDIRDAEAIGYGTVWVTDHGLTQDPWMVLAAASSVTNSVQLGPGLMNPYSRHPAQLTAAIATLDELSEGRAVLGLAAGGTSHNALGVARVKPAEVLRDTVALVRGLLAGDKASMDRGGVTADDVGLDFRAPRADIPIVLGGRGPQVLEVAGEVADGVIVGNIATRSGWNHALASIARGASRGGRSTSGIGLTAWLYCSISQNHDAAVDAVRPLAAASVLTSLHVLDSYGLELPEEIAHIVNAPDWAPTPDSVVHIGELLPTALIEAFSLAGSAAACRAQLEDLVHDVPTITNVVIVPLPVSGQTTHDTMVDFAGEVAADL